MTQRRAKPDYWELSFYGFGRGNRWRWEYDQVTSKSIWGYVNSRTCNRVPTPWPDPTPILCPDAFPKGVLAPYDAVNIVSDIWAASPRLQKLLHSLVGDAIEFLPAQFQGDYAYLAEGYKCVSYNHALLCLHEDSFDIDEETGEEWVVSPIVDLDKIPSGTLIARIYDYPIAFMHDSVHNALRVAGMTGFIFNEELPLKSNMWGQFKHDYVKKRKTKKE
jgi:hypothetical protein